MTLLLLLFNIYLIVYTIWIGKIYFLAKMAFTMKAFYELDICNIFFRACGSYIELQKKLHKRTLF